MFNTNYFFYSQSAKRQFYSFIYLIIMAKNIDKMLLRLLLFRQYTRGTAVGCKIVTNVKMVKKNALSLSFSFSLFHTHIKRSPKEKQEQSIH